MHLYLPTGPAVMSPLDHSEPGGTDHTVGRVGVRNPEGLDLAQQQLFLRQPVQNILTAKSEIRKIT